MIGSGTASSVEKQEPVLSGSNFKLGNFITKFRTPH
jgi:hypothetical protein